MDFIEKSVSFSEGKRKNKKSSKKGAIFALATIPLVMTIGNSMLIPVLPVMENQIQITSFQTSLIITVYSVVAIFLIPVAGFISDHVGRKKVIVPSLLIAAIGGFISGWAAWKLTNPYILILIGRSLQGVGAAGAAPIVMPLIGDMFKNEEEVSTNLGIIETSNTLGKVVSPILGAFLAGIFWYLPFFVIPVFCTFSLLLMIFLVKRAKVEHEPVPLRIFVKKLREIFKLNGRWLFATFFIGIILMFVLFGVLFYLSDTLEKNFGINDLKKGLILAVPLGALCLSSLITGKVIKDHKLLMKWITFGGLLLLAASIFSLSFSKNLWYMIIMFLLSGVGIGASLPCLDHYVTEGIEQKQRGTITSLFHSMRFIGVASGPPVMALLMKQMDNGMFYVLSGVATLACLLTFFAIRPESE